MSVSPALFFVIIKLILTYFKLASEKRFALIKLILVCFRLASDKKFVSAKLLVT